MTRRGCPRSWQVEAAVDGRLEGKELAAFERHLEHCAECGREARAVRKLGEALRELPASKRDGLSSHRLRQRIMADMNDAILATPKTRRTHRVSALVLTTLVLGVGALVFGTRAASRVAHVEVHAQPNTRWHELRSGNSRRIDFLEGEALFKIRRDSPAESVVIAVPDGEIEDLGTVLTVRVSERTTTRIAVHEGEVVARLRGQPELRLIAGQSWTSPTKAVTPIVREIATNGRETTTTPSSVTSVQGERKAHPAVREAKDPRRQSPRKPTQTAPRESVSGPASHSSAEEEDGMYLRIVELLERGRTVEARALGREYLMRFPNGFRRREVSSVTSP